MRAILIDPYQKQFSEIDYDGNYKTVYKLIDCRVFQVVGIGGEHVIYVDEEGLLHEPKPFFKWGAFPQPIAGKGLIVRVDVDGHDVAATIPLAAVEHHLSFPLVRFTGIDTTVEQGEGFVVINNKANFERLQ
jgi:hypothetical protein